MMHGYGVTSGWLKVLIKCEKHFFWKYIHEMASYPAAQTLLVVTAWFLIGHAQYYILMS